MRSLKSSSVKAFRTAAVLFAGAAVFVGVLFVRALAEREIRSGLFTYGAMCVATAIGLWRVRRWGRSLALIVAMGNLGLGTLALMAVLMSRRGTVIAPSILIALSLVLSFWLSRPVFGLPDD